MFRTYENPNHKIIINILYSSLLQIWAKDQPELRSISIKTSNQFLQQTIRDYSLLVLFYADHCQHCKTDKVTFENLNYAGEGIAAPSQTLLVNCELNDDLLTLCSEQNVLAYPTIKLYPKGKPAVRYTAKLRNRQNILSWVKSQLLTNTPEQKPNKPVDNQDIIIDDQVLTKSLSSGDKLAIFCQNKENCLPTSSFSALASKIKANNNAKHIQAAYVDCSKHPAVCDKFVNTRNAASSTSWLVLLKHGQELFRIPVDPQLLTPDVILNYLVEHLASMNSEDLDFSVINTYDKWLAAKKTPNLVVKFFAPWCGHCMKMAPTWEKLMNDINKQTPEEFSKLGKSPKLIKIDCTILQKVCQEENIKGYPTLRFYIDNGQRSEFQGHRQYDDIFNWMVQTLVNINPGNKEVSLVNSMADLSIHNFYTPVPKKRFRFVMFYTTWCESCDDAFEEFEKISQVLGNSETFLGRVNCEKERQLCHQKNVISYYPYFGLFSYVQNEIEDVFEKKRDSESMIEFLRGYREGL